VLLVARTCVDCFAESKYTTLPSSISDLVLDGGDLLLSILLAGWLWATLDGTLALVFWVADPGDRLNLVLLQVFVGGLLPFLVHCAWWTAGEEASRAEDDTGSCDTHDGVHEHLRVLAGRRLGTRS